MDELYYSMLIFKSSLFKRISIKSGKIKSWTRLKYAGRQATNQKNEEKLGSKPKIPDRSRLALGSTSYDIHAPNTVLYDHDSTQN